MPLKIFTFFIRLILPFFTVASVVEISIVVANVVGIEDVVNTVGVVSIVSIVLVSNGVDVCVILVVDSVAVAILVVGMLCTIFVGLNKSLT